MRTVLIGAVESTRIALRTLAAAPGWTVAAVVTLPPALAARHSDFVDLADDARAAGAALIHADDGNAPAIVAAVAAVEPDLLFVIGWSQLCGAAMLGTARHGAIGYHPAPLPHLRGRGVIPWTILLGEKITAGTLFWIDGGTDTGPILVQKFFHVAADDTAGSLYARHMAVLGDMLAAAAPLLAGGDAPRIVQDERFASWAAKRTPEDGRIDWALPADDILRLIRAVGRPYPGAFTTLGALAGDDRLVIWQASAWSESQRHAAMAGQVIAVEGTDFIVRCGDGRAVRVTEWDRLSKRAPRLHARLGGR